MKHIDSPLNSAQSAFRSYSVGFALSLILTGVAFIVVTKQLYSGPMLIAVIVTLAIAQMLVQLLFFLHLGRETKPRWKLVTMLFMLVVLGIVVFGSLWIMQNLNYNMSSHETSEYIIEDEGISR